MIKNVIFPAKTKKYAGNRISNCVTKELAGTPRVVSLPFRRSQNSGERCRLRLAAWSVDFVAGLSGSPKGGVFSV